MVTKYYRKGWPWGNDTLEIGKKGIGESHVVNKGRGVHRRITQLRKMCPWENHRTLTREEVFMGESHS